MAHHYMHQTKMKRQGFIKNKVMVWLVVANVEKVSLIPYINVFPPTFEGDDGDDLWWVRSQQHFCVTYKIHAPFTEYVNGTCEWALRGNFCNIRLLLYSLILALHQRISLNIVAPILGLIVVVWNPCSLTWHTYNWMMEIQWWRLQQRFGRRG